AAAAAGVSASSASASAAAAGQSAQTAAGHENVARLAGSAAQSSASAAAASAGAAQDHSASAAQSAATAGRSEVAVRDVVSAASSSAAEARASAEAAAGSAGAAGISAGAAAASAAASAASAASTTAASQRAVQLSLGEYTAFIEDDDAITAGGYPVTRSARYAGTMVRFYGEVIEGASATVSVERNGSRVYGPVPISAGAPVSRDVSIAIAKGDRITYNVVADAKRLWLQLDGGEA
ncbi:MAG TPA: hypothetical protein VIG97_03965, partial [Luteimonas sp.]